MSMVSVSVVSLIRAMKILKILKEKLEIGIFTCIYQNCSLEGTKDHTMYAC